MWRGWCWAWIKHTIARAVVRRSVPRQGAERLVRIIHEALSSLEFGGKQDWCHSDQTDFTGNDQLVKACCAPRPPSEAQFQSSPSRQLDSNGGACPGSGSTRTSGPRPRRAVSTCPRSLPVTVSCHRPIEVLPIRCHSTCPSTPSFSKSNRNRSNCAPTNSASSAC